MNKILKLIKHNRSDISICHRSHIKFKVRSFPQLKAYNISLVISTYYTSGHHLITQIFNWAEPERAPHWSVVEAYVGASLCARSVNKKIPIEKPIKFCIYMSERHVVRGM